MNDENREKIKKIFLDTFKGVDEKSFDFNKDRAEFENWDSLTHMQLSSEIESAFGLSFEMDELIDINKPEDFVVLVQKKQNA